MGGEEVVGYGVSAPGCECECGYHSWAHVRRLLSAGSEGTAARYAYQVVEHHRVRACARMHICQRVHAYICTCMFVCACHTQSIAA